MKNKKIVIIALFVLAVSVFLLVKGLGKGEEPSDNPAIVITTWQNEEEEKSNKTKKDVKITVPMSVIPEEYRNNLEAYREEHGYESVKKDINGNVRIKMSSLSYGLLQTQAGITVINAVYEIADLKQYSYIKEVKQLDTEDFRSITVSVNADKYAEADDSAFQAMADSCFYYHIFSEKPVYKCEITIVDSKTGEVIDTKTYRQ